MEYKMKITSKLPRFRRVFLVLLLSGAALVVLLFSAGLFLTRPFTEAPWEELPPNPDSIYQSAGNGQDIPVISPFHLKHDPMTGLLLMNFENDPDEIYTGFEPQSFDDSIHGRGLLVIGWRLDGKVDVYYQTGLRLDPATYGIAGKGLNEMVERPFSEAFFELGSGGAQVDISFSDLQGRSVRLLIRETDKRPRSFFGLLAPMGDAASEPPAMPLVYVDQFYFVRRAGTEFLIEIDGRSHNSDFIPLILDGALVHALRYSADPFIVTWNPDSDAGLRMLEAGKEEMPGFFVTMADGVQYNLEEKNSFREIRRISLGEGNHEVVVDFSPAFPQLLALAEGIEVTGAFRITAQPDLGTVRGSWRVLQSGERLDLEIVPDGGWTPGPAPRMARLLFRAVSIFREWPTTYIWRGSIQLHPDKAENSGTDGESPDFRSGWERTGQ
jgi:hypothetical protein